jgi:S1-C subfamily serine protease
MDDNSRSSFSYGGSSGEPYGYPPYPPPGYPSVPPPRKPRRPRGWVLTTVTVAVAALAGAGVGHVLWQPGLDSFGQTPSITGPSPASVGSGSPSGPVGQPDTGVVDITARLGNQQGAAAGTGMVLSPSGEVITNNHVIQGASSINVTDVSDGRSYPATVVGYDRTDDVAVLQMQGASKLHTIALGDSATVGVGDPVVAVGNAGGAGGTPSRTEGTVAALNQTITASDDTGANTQRLIGLLQVTANLQPGDSGGPLVDHSGKVIGMNAAGSQTRRAAGAMGYAIPIDKVVTVDRQIDARQESATVHIGATGFLGVQVASSGAQQDTGSPDQASSGAVLVGVEPGSPAQQAGLSPGDVIVSVDQRPVDSSTSLQSVLSAHHPGDRVALQWVGQNGQQHSGFAELAAGPPE